MVERIATITPIATRNTPFTISLMMPQRMPNTPKAVRIIKPHIANPMYCATCLKFAVAVISSLFLIFLFFMRIQELRELSFKLSYLPLVYPTFFLCVFLSHRSFSFRVLEKVGIRECKVFRGNTTRRAGDFRRKQEAWPCFPVQSRNYLCAQNENDWLMRLTERRKMEVNENRGRLGRKNFRGKSVKRGNRLKEKDITGSVKRANHDKGSMIVSVPTELVQPGGNNHSSRFVRLCVTACFIHEAGWHTLHSLSASGKRDSEKRKIIWKPVKAPLGIGAKERGIASSV